MYRLPYHWFPEKGLSKFDREEKQRIIFSLVNSYLKSSCHRYLDIGCGDGRWTSDIHKFLGGKIESWGIDISERAIGFAKLISPEINFKVKRGESTNFDSSIFDLVTMIEVLEHIEERAEKQILKESHRLLKKGGLLIITTPSDNLRLTLHHFRHYSLYRIEELLHENKFKIVEVKGHGRPIYGIKKEIRKFMKQFPLIWKFWKFSYRETVIEKASHLIVAAKPIKDYV